MGVISTTEATPHEIQNNSGLIIRVTGGDPTRVAPMARELIEHNVDILVPLSPAAVQATTSLTSTVPILAFDLETDPIGSGLVKSLARPGGNVTGVFFDFPEFSKKWLELMKETLPRLSRIGVLWDPATGLTQRQAIETVAAVMNIALDVVEVRALADLDAAIDRRSPQPCRCTCHAVHPARRRQLEAPC